MKIGQNYAASAGKNIEKFEALQKYSMVIELAEKRGRIKISKEGKRKGRNTRL